MTACTYCHRLTLTPEQRETEPYPDQIRMCPDHQRLYDVIDALIAEEAA